MIKGDVSCSVDLLIVEALDVAVKVSDSAGWFFCRRLETAAAPFNHISLTEISGETYESQ